MAEFTQARRPAAGRGATAGPARQGQGQGQGQSLPVPPGLVQMRDALNGGGDAARLSALAGTLAAGPAVQRMANRTGLPDGLKTGAERLSGLPLDDVRVHRNSGQPAQLQAAAFAQGTDIHLAQGQERHLPHELWHVVQQKQGRVRPTLQAQGLPLNTDPALEREATSMGERAAGAGPAIQAMPLAGTAPSSTARPGPAVIQAVLVGAGGVPLTAAEIEAFRDKANAAEKDELDKAQASEHEYTVVATRHSVLVNRVESATKRVRDPDNLPFPERYTGDKETMTLEDKGGIVSRPLGKAVDWRSASRPLGAEDRVVIANNIDRSHLPTESKRAVQQGTVMGISPNDAAKLLGLPDPNFPNWEWLHLVAFSIKPTHADELSEGSQGLIKRYNQPQQISENLVLGTAASNTEMLSWESAIKKVLNENENMTLQLSVMPVTEKRTVTIPETLKKVIIPLGYSITYDFQFALRDGSDSMVSMPFHVEFDIRSPKKPARQSYFAIQKVVDDAIQKMKGKKLALANLPEGQSLTGMIPLKKYGGKTKDLIGKRAAQHDHGDISMSDDDDMDVAKDESMIAANDEDMKMSDDEDMNPPRRSASAPVKKVKLNDSDV